MSNECFVKNVPESNGTSILDGCGNGRPTAINCLSPSSLKTTCPDI